MHALTTDHNGDPRCTCGWAPKPQAPYGIPGQLRAAGKIRRHANTWRLADVTGTGSNQFKTYWFKRPHGDHTSLWTAKPAAAFWGRFGATR